MSGQNAGYYNMDSQQGYNMNGYGGQQQQQQWGQQQGYQQQYGQQYQEQQQPPPPQQQQYQPPSGGPEYQQQKWNGPQHMPPPPNYQQNFGESDTKPDFQQAFKIEKPKWNDLWAAILFLAVFAGFAALSGYALYYYSQYHSFSGDGIYDASNDFSLNTNTILLFMFCLAIALVLGYGYVLLARYATKALIWTTGILNIIMTLVLGIYMISRGTYSGLVFILFAAFTAFAFWTWIPRIPFSVLMLQTVIDVSKSYGHVFLVSFISGIIGIAFAAWFSVTMIAIYVRFQPAEDNPACAEQGGCGSGVVIGLMVFITFAAYYITEVIKNTTHVIIGGVFGSWYFLPNQLPKGATRGATKRALTYSFGSICVGSLFVAIINFLRHLASVAQSQGGTGNIATDICFCLLRCLLGLIQWAIEFLNKYAYAYIALYGKAYIESAKATWAMIKDRGIEGLIQQCLIGPVFSMGATFVGAACAFLAYLYLVFTDPGYNTNGEFTAVVLAYAFLIGLQVTNMFTTPLSSGVDTIFVGMAWDPDVMANEHPELWAKMVQVYPQVQQAVRR